MPTRLPSRPLGIRPRLLRDSARFLFLMAHGRIIDAQLAAIYRRANRQGREPDGPTLIRLMTRWLAIHEQIGAMMPGAPEPPYVEEARALLRMIEKTKTGLGEADQIPVPSRRRRR